MNGWPPCIWVREGEGVMLVEGVQNLLMVVFFVSSSSMCPPFLRLVSTCQKARISSSESPSYRPTGIPRDFTDIFVQFK